MILVWQSGENILLWQEQRIISSYFLVGRGRVIPDCAHRLLLVLNSGVTPGGTWGTIYNAKAKSTSTMCKVRTLAAVLSLQFQETIFPLIEKTIFLLSKKHALPLIFFLTRTPRRLIIAKTVVL